MTAKTSSTTATFDWDTVSGGGTPLDIADGTNYYVYGPLLFGGTAPIEQISTSGSVSFLASTQAGVQAVFTNGSSPVLKELAAYSLFGNPVIQSGTKFTAFGFQGSYTDASGLIYVIDRYYDPSTDQFLSVDPLVAKTGQPYAFTGDDPLNETDPLGLSAPSKEDMIYNQETTAFAAYCAGTHNRGRRADFNGSGSHCGQRWYQSKSLGVAADIATGTACALAGGATAGVVAAVCLGGAAADAGVHTAQDRFNHCSSGRTIFDATSGFIGTAMAGLSILGSGALKGASVGSKVIFQGTVNAPSAVGQAPVSCN